MRRVICTANLFVALVVPAALTGQSRSPVTIRDAIAMVRVPHFWGEEPFFAISADGKSGALVTWQGDLARNVNVYRLYVFDVATVKREHKLPAPAVQLDFKGDTNDYGFRVTGMDRPRVFTDRK